MDLKTAITSAPLLRKAWRVVPGPLKIPLIAAGAFLWFKSRGEDDEEQAERSGESA